jgi:CRISPR/Cas system CSM-associated protein Csm4 (group 5 of RAMP superfamily)
MSMHGVIKSGIVQGIAMKIRNRQYFYEGSIVQNPLFIVTRSQYLLLGIR